MGVWDIFCFYFLGFFKNIFGSSQIKKMIKR